MASSGDHILKTLDEFEEERKKKDKQIRCLKDHVPLLENKNGETKQQMDR